MQLLLVRHGESIGNVTQVMQTREEPLTERGRRQAREIAAHLAKRDDIQALYASPLARAWETSQIIGAALGMEPEPREDLAEISVGNAAGLTFKQWEERFSEEAVRFHSEGMHYAFPDGESGIQLGERTAAEIDRILERCRRDQGAVVIVSHGGALAWILAHLLEEPRDAWPAHQFNNCSVTELTIDPDSSQPVVVCRNEVGHLSAEPTEEVATGQA